MQRSPVIAPALGAGNRRFESSHPDQTINIVEIPIALIAIYVIYKLYKLAKYLISYYDFMHSVKLKKMNIFKDELNKMYPILGDIKIDKYTIEFNTDKFNAPKLGEKVIVCGIEYKCFESIDISDMDDYLKGTAIHNISLYREDF